MVMIFKLSSDNTKSNLIYIDTIYNPLETRTIKFKRK